MSTCDFVPRNVKFGRLCSLCTVGLEHHQWFFIVEKPNELIRSMINYEMWSCAVCPIKRRWRVPRCPILSWWPVLEASSQTRCIFIPAAVHLYTSPYKHLVPSCSILCSHFLTLPALLLRRKTLLPEGSCIIITFPMIDFLITTISVQFRAFSIDWHVYKMRMNQKVNQMTNSLFTLIHHPTANGGPIYFFCKKTDGID